MMFFPMFKEFRGVGVDWKVGRALYVNLKVGAGPS